MGPSPEIPLGDLTKFCQVGFWPKVSLRAFPRGIGLDPARLRQKMSEDIYVKIQSLQSPLYDGMGNQIFCVSLDNVFISRDGYDWKPVATPNPKNHSQSSESRAIQRKPFLRSTKAI